jgi:ssDNA-binding replication factor A large subunit
MKELVDQIKSRLKDQGIQVPEEEIVARLKKLMEDFHVPEAEARRSVLNYFYKEHGVAPTRVSSERVKVNEISEPNQWVDLEVKVLSLWEPASEAISQTGLLGDATGSIKFVKWAKSGLPDLVEGKSYSLKRLVTDDYQGRLSVKLNRTSQVAELDHDIDAVGVTISGPPEDKKISDISEPGAWVNLKVKVLSLWDSSSDTISQSGLIGDETGALKFVKWAKSELPDLVEGKSYHLENVVTDEFQGRFSVKLNSTSKIEELDQDIDAVAAPLRGQSVELKVADISEPGTWVDVRVKVVHLWKAASDAISQSGIVGDNTGSLRFVKWAKSGLPDLVEGKSYHLENVVTDEFQGRFSIKLNRTSQVTELEEEIEVGSKSFEFTGAMVDVQKGSGLIKRCPKCERSLSKGICRIPEHGKVDGIYDLRIKAVLDDGQRVQDIIINRETTERLIGLTLEDAKKMAMDTLDHEVVRSLIEERLLGRHYTVTGPRIDRYMLVETINDAPAVKASDVDEIMHLAEVV